MLLGKSSATLAVSFSAVGFASPVSTDAGGVNLSHTYPPVYIHNE